MKPHLYDDLAESRRLIKLYPVEKHHQVRMRLERRKEKVIKFICAVFLSFLSATYFFPEISIWLDGIHAKVVLLVLAIIIIGWFGIWCLRKGNVF